MDPRNDGKPIKGFERYRVMEDGRIRNRDGYTLKPNKDCVCVRINDKRKTFSITRLVAIYWLDMPDDNKHKAYKKDPKGGYGIDNVAWDTVANLNKERLEKARQVKHEYNKQCEEDSSE